MQGKLVGGRYEIVRPLAEGGMGAVYEARHHMTKKTVALKILFPHVGRNEGARQRFLREVSAPATIGHEGIVEVYDSGVDSDDGSLFVAMELLRGETVREWLDKGGHTRDEILDLFDRIFDPLAAAHARGIVHRDLKPENVFLHHERGEAVVKILDFGIARDLDASAQSVTQTSVAMGTPHYMAPEQAMSAKSVDARADVWALGAMLYEALTGRTPFDGETASAIVVYVCTQPHAPIRSLVPDLDPKVADLVDRCLAKEAGQRPSHAGDLQLALRAARPGRVVPPTMAIPAVSTSATRDGNSDAQPSYVSGAPTGPLGASSPAAFGAPPAAFGAPAAGTADPGPFGTPAPEEPAPQATGPVGYGTPAPGGHTSPTPGGHITPTPSGFGGPSATPAPRGFGGPSATPSLGGFATPAPSGFDGPSATPSPGGYATPAPSGFGGPSATPSPGGYGMTAPSGYATPAPSGFAGPSTTPTPAPGSYGTPPPSAPFGGAPSASSPTPMGFGAPSRAQPAKNDKLVLLAVLGGGLVLAAITGVAVFVGLGGDAPKEEPPALVGTPSSVAGSHATTPSSGTGPVTATVITPDGGGELLVDGVSQGPVASGSAFSLTAGSHVVSLRRSGTVYATQQVQAMSGQPLSVNLSRPTTATGAAPDVRRGRLEAGDQTLNSGELQDPYTFTWTQGRRIHVEARSTDFDTYLIVKPPTGDQLDNDDMAPGSTNAGLDVDVTQTGTWTVIVTSFRAGETGAYELEVR